MKNSKILKAISYVLIPILVAIIGITALYQVGENEYKNIESRKENYFQSDDFLGNYMTELSSEENKLIYHNSEYSNVSDENYIIYYNTVDYSYRYNDIKDFYYVIVYKNKVFTNVELTTETNTLQKIKDFVSNRDENTKFANIVNGNVESNSEIITTKAIQYFDNFNTTYYTKGEGTSIVNNQEMQEELSEKEELSIETPNYSCVTTNINDFEIYTSYKEILIENSDDEFIEKMLNSLEPYSGYMLYSIPVCSVALILIAIYLVISIGHVDGKEEIDLNDLDKIPLEIILLVAMIAISIICAIISEISKIEYYQLAISSAVAAYLGTYIICAVSGVTVIKRIKAKVLFKNTITGKVFGFVIKIIKKIFNKINKVWDKVNESLTATLKLVAFTCIYALLLVFLVAAFNGFGILIDFISFCYIFYKIIERINSFEKVEKHLKEMYDGKHPDKLSEKDFTSEFKNTVTYINDISNGFENAIQEGIKSERLKTELITNVSHDIKTPLTSIINYVDLLKKENIENEKVKEYIEVLDNKSKRLKKLTEDLVEASKASSGNVKLEMQKIHITELIKQSAGEFEDKFKERGLETIVNYPEKDICIFADNRYLYRVIENVFSNVSKYALDNSRVYVDILQKDKKVSIEVKNISKDRLNISVDELMQRFVRGDKSRTTEGSGLGLSISRSLTELQKGKFELQVDGDLFKVKLEFEIIE